MRVKEKLSVREIAGLRDAGKYGDGGGLYLHVRSPGTRSWVFRYMKEWKAHEMGLGSYPDVSLAVARKKATAQRALLGEGKDPLGVKAAGKLERKLEQARRFTFRQCAERFIEAQKAGWKCQKHQKQWESTMEMYAFPVFGNLPIAEIDTSMVLKTLEPIWKEKPETASRVRGRIERILDYARVREYRAGDNPARWRGHLDTLLPARSKIARVKHFPALPWRELSAFMKAVANREGMAVRALEITILTALRTSEVLEAPWSEIDLDVGVWTIPGWRMKGGATHRVPLSEPVVEILADLPRADGGTWVFPGRPGKYLSNMSMLMVLRRMERTDLTVHGFRSTFRDWSAECTNTAREVCELALAHVNPNKVEAAYRRSDLFEKRRRLMRQWASYCYSAHAEAIHAQR